MATYTRETLEATSIFAIRDLAKEVGVSSPTKKNKGELIDLILKITSGEMAPPEAPRRGRPKKQTVIPAPDVETEAKPAVSAEEKPAEEKSAEDKHKPREVRFVREIGQGRDRHRQQAFRDEKRRDEGPADQLREGFLEVNPDGYGFLRVRNCECNDMDAYVPAAKIKQFGLRRGDRVRAYCRTLQEGKPAAVVNVISINGVDFAEVGKRPNFDDLIPIYPDERLRLEIPSRPRDYATRCIDIVAPIGKGQRGIIVSPPKAGKTTLLKMIAGSIAENYPDMVLFVLLIDERPEEVTDMQRSVKGEVVYSTFDEMPEHHTKTAEMLLDRAKRLVELGKDVVILMDSLTRLARAYNTTIPPTGRTLSGGVDPGALHSPKRFFGSARNIEHGGSLTIIATALIETGSRMDDVIFEEFKGTGNMEIHLDRKLSERRIFPAIDLAKSGTRKEELLLTPSELAGAWGVRKLLSAGDSAEATENLLNMLVKTSSNKEFIDQINMQLKIFQKEGYNLRKPVL